MQNTNIAQKLNELKCDDEATQRVLETLKNNN